MNPAIRILYAEDNSQDADLTRSHFAENAPDFAIEVVGTGKECLERLRETGYDLLLLDHRLPDMDGLDVLKALYAGSRVPVVMVTGMGDEELVVKALRLGAANYIAKRGDYLETLPALLRGVVEEERRRRDQGRPSGTSSRRILYVENNEMDIELTLRHFAESAPHLTVDVVKSCAEARARLERPPAYDLALIDLRMPDQSGLDFVREAMGRRLPLPPFIIITGRGDESAAIATLKLGAADYITKREGYLDQLTSSIEQTIDRAWLNLLNQRLQAEVAERKRAEESLRFANVRLQTLWQVATMEHIDTRTVSDEILAAIVQMTGSEFGFYGFVNQDESAMIIHKWSGEAMAGCSVTDKPLEFTISQAGVWAEAVRRRAPFFMNDYSAPHAGKKGLPEGHVAIRRMLVIPDLSSGMMTAVAAVANKAVDYTEEDARQLKAFLAGIQAITDRKRAEEERARLEEQLRVSQKMEAIGSLAGGVAHDFNNMLGVILGHVELALMKAGFGQPLLGDLQAIHEATERSTRLTRQLLAFARKQAIDPRVVDLNEMVGGMIKMLQRLIGENIELAWVPGEGLWPVLVDAAQIDQILANLCVNARDAIAGVGKLTIETGNAVMDGDYCVLHPGSVPGEYVRITVSDSGCGMDKTTIDRLFEPFFTTKEKGKGTGLGLSTVYGIVKQNNGFIDVCSEPDRGTTFKIHLPRHAGEAEQARTQAPSEPAPCGHETILLVEDDSSYLELATTMLGRQGYTVLPAGTPAEAIRLAGERSGEIDLLVTDVVMPGMNGRDLAKELQSRHPRLKCLFMSGYADDVITHQGVIDTGIHFLGKPFTSTDLARKVREALDEGVTGRG